MMLTSAEVGDGEYEKIISAGVDDYFIKPFSITKILLHLKKGLLQRNLCIETNRMEEELIKAHHNKNILKE